MALRRGYVRLGVYGRADLGLLHHGGAPGSKTAAGCLLAAAVAVCLPGCGAPEQATIVAVMGCNIAPDIFGLRVQTRGDFPPGSAARAVVTEGTALVGQNLDDVAGVTVEGLVGDDLVGAVGRTTRLQSTGEIPVYYAGIDSLCDVEGEEFVEASAPGAMAVGPMGDVLIVGGTDAEGALTGEIMHLTDDENVPRLADRQVPPAVGQTLHATGDRSFLLIGGAGEGPDAHAGAIQIDVEDDARVRVTPIELHEDGGVPQPRAFHAAALWNDRILVTGGCAAVQAGRCLPEAGSVLRSSVLVDVSSDPPRVLPGPTLSAGRYDHQVHVARDEVLFVVGGRGVGDQPNVGIERLLPGGAWEAYGPSLVDELPDDVGIDGSVLLEGGLLILSLSNGRLLWMSEDETGELAQWCRYVPADTPTEPPRRNLDQERQMEGDGGLVPIQPCFIGQQWRPPVPRLMLALRGERILAENYIVPMASPGLAVEDVIDASQVGSRTGGLASLLADGSVLVAGGYAPGTEGPDRQPAPPVPLRPLVRRLRPPLDGPDERIPSLSDTTGSFIAIRPDRITATGDSLEIRPLEASSFPTARARVRGFRSRSFRFEVTLSMSASDVTPHIILEQGAVAGVSVRLGADSIRGVARAAWDSEVPFGCGPTPEDYWMDDEPRTLQVDVRPGSLVISDGDQLLARCPIQDLDVPVTIGVGATGFSGTLTARSFRLSRI